MTAEVPSNTALATSDTSARVGAGDLIIDSNICVAVMTGRPRAMQSRMMRFCRWGSSSMPSSDPEVAAGDHDRPRRLDDPVEVLDRGTRLDLGHDQRPAGVGLGADAAHVVGRAHEAERHHVDALVDEGVEHAEVLGGGGGQAQAVRRDVQPGPALHRPAVGDHGLGAVAVDRLDQQDDAPVADRQRVADVDVTQQVGVVDAQHGVVGTVQAGDQRDAVPGGQFQRGVAEPAQADLGAGEVDQDPDRAAQFVGHAPDGAVAQRGRRPACRGPGRCGPRPCRPP